MCDKVQALDSSSPPLFVVSNHHGPDAEVPPTGIVNLLMQVPA